MKRFMKVILVGVFITTLALGLSSCSNERDDVFLVGNTAATSGIFAMVGVPFNNGILAYFQRVNEAGGIHGRQIEFVHYDDGFDAVAGLAFTESLIHDDQVFAIVGHFGTPTIGATLNLLKETGVPTVYFAAGIGSLFNDSAFTNAQGRNLFPVQAIYVTEGRVLVARAIEEYNARTIGVIFTSDEAGHDYLRGIQYQMNRLGDEFRLVTSQISPVQTDVSSAVLSMRNENVDVIIVATLQQAFVVTTNAIIAAGLDVPVFTSYINADAMTIAGIAADYLGQGATFPIYSTAWLDVGTTENPCPEYLDFIAGVMAFEGVTNIEDSELALSAFAMAGWIAGSTFVAGLRNMDSNDLSREAFIDAMERTPINLPMGGVMDFSNGQRTGTEDLSLVRANVAEAAWESVRPIEPLRYVLQRVEG